MGKQDKFRLEIFFFYRVKNFLGFVSRINNNGVFRFFVGNQITIGFNWPTTIRLMIIFFVFSSLAILAN